MHKHDSGWHIPFWAKGHIMVWFCISRKEKNKRKEIGKHDVPVSEVPRNNNNWYCT